MRVPTLPPVTPAALDVENALVTSEPPRSLRYWFRGPQPDPLRWVAWRKSGVECRDGRCGARPLR